MPILTWKPGSKPALGARLVAVAALSLTVAGCAHEPAYTGATVKTTTLPHLSFGYDRSRPLGFSDRGVVSRLDSISVHDIVYVSGGLTVQGYLVEPSGHARHPGIVLVHGSGGDRSELLGDALALAKRGAVALTITEPSTFDPPSPPTTAAQLLAESRSVTVRDVVAVRRAGDVLASLPTVDASHLGYLGWSAGAKTGTFVGASDRRFRALALLSGGGDKLSAFVASAPRAIRPLVRRELGSVDPLRYVALTRPGSVLLEDGSQDTVVPHHALENMIAAASSRTTVRWYAAGHALNARAYRDAFTWLMDKLSVEAR